MSSTETKHLVFVIPSITGGGAERIIHKIALYLTQNERAAYKVTLIAILKEDVVCDTTGFNCIKLEAQSVSRSAASLYRLLRKIRPDAVISTLKHVTFVTSFVCMLLGIRHVSRVANTLSAETAHSYRWRAIAKINHIIDDSIIAVSKGVMNDLVFNKIASSEKIQVIPNPVLLPDIWQARPMRSNGELIRALFVGRLVQQKNIEFLLSVVADNPNDIELCIVGSGPMLKSLQLLVDDYRISKRVSFVGHADDVNSYYRRSDVLLLSSYFEGMPNVLLEALSNGLPVVAYDCPSGPADIICSDLQGSLVSSLDPRIFYNAILHEFQNDSVKKRWARRLLVQKNYSLESISMSYAHIACESK